MLLSQCVELLTGPTAALARLRCGFAGTWQGTVVAVKTMLFPAAMSGKEKREKMAIMETAISSSLSHPNIVQTYTYVVKPLTGELALQVGSR